jgi:hypothetical protein
MIAEDLKALFADLKRDIAGLKTDLILMRYDLEQIDRKLEEMKLQQVTESVQEPDPFTDRRFTQI